MNGPQEQGLVKVGEIGQGEVVVGECPRGLTIPERIGRGITPTIIKCEGERTQKRFWEFFAATIRNKNTRIAYLIAVHQFFDWCELRGLTLERIEPLHVAAYVEKHPGAPPTVKQHLAALRMLFDWLVTGQVVPHNPVTSVRGPKCVLANNVGKTPVLTPRQMRRLLDSIDITTMVGLRDRALIGLMVFSFARVSAAVAMRVRDYEHQGEEAFFVLHEKGGKFNRVPAHGTAQIYLDDYIQAAGIGGDGNGSLFRSNRSPKNQNKLSNEQMTRFTAIQMVKKRAREAGFPEVTCHSFRGTGITAYLKNGGTIENAAAIAGHSSTRTTQLYDRSRESISFEEIARIVI